MADDYDSMTEDQLSTLRGDEPQAAPEVETPAPEAEPVALPEAETPEPEEAPEAPAAPEPDPKPYMIPKSRYDAVMGRLRAAEAKLSERPVAEAPPPPPPPPGPSIDERLTELDVEYTKALADGQYEEAAKLMSQARALERSMFSQALNQVATQTRTQANVETREQLRYDGLLAEVERLVPAVAPDSDSYDEGLVAEISELATAFEARGARAADALEKALNYVFPTGWRPTAATTPAPAKARTTDVRRNAEAAKSLPPKLTAGESSDKAGITGKLDIMKLSDAELEKLTETQLAQLRGDLF